RRVLGRAGAADDLGAAFLSRLLAARAERAHFVAGDGGGALDHDRFVLGSRREGSKRVVAMLLRQVPPARASCAALAIAARSAARRPARDTPRRSAASRRSRDRPARGSATCADCSPASALARRPAPAGPARSRACA